MKEKKKRGSRLQAIAALAMVMTLLLGLTATVYADDPAQSSEATTTEAKQETTTEAPANPVPFLTLEGSQNGSKITLKWGSVSGAPVIKVYGGYVGYNMGLLKTIKNTKTKSLTLKKLDGKKINQKKVFKFKVAAYKSEEDPEPFVKSPAIYIAGSKHKKYTNTKSLKITKKSFTLAPGQSDKIKAKTTLSAKKKKHLPAVCGPKISYYSTNKPVATVSPNGTITGQSPGTCIIYVYTVNGKTQKVNVTVK